jgi:hypothetical protein
MLGGYDERGSGLMMRGLFGRGDGEDGEPGGAVREVMLARREVNVGMPRWRVRGEGRNILFCEMQRSVS